MIQRIQSFLLVLALVGFVLLFLFPTATFEAKINANVTTSSLTLVPGEDILNAETGESFIAQKSVILMIMAIVLGLGTLIGIFMYKNRVRQMRFVSMLGLINLVYIGIMFLSCIPDAAEALSSMGEVSTTYSVGTFVPIVTLILIVIAQRAIRSDEMKVRAADRIR
ncbi:MAG: DUF4293 domain-containing protein [Bacteroidales bacterium]|nr:DUF4293 domain-containing protein [Bacteroidales bacterium]